MLVETALFLVLAAGLEAADRPEEPPMSCQSTLGVTPSHKPFWITSSGIRREPLPGWALVAAVRETDGGPARKCLVQGVLSDGRFESGEAIDVPGLAAHPEGSILYREGSGHLQARSSLAGALADLAKWHDELRRLASLAAGKVRLDTAPLEVLRTSIDSGSGLLVVRYGAALAPGSDPHGLYHHVDVVAFYDLMARKIGRLNVFPVPLE